MPANQPIAFGIIGCRHGHIKGLLTQLLKIPGAQCAGIYEEDDESVQPILEEFPVQRARSADELLENDEVAVIGTATINRGKGPLLVRAMEAGKHVIADKPLCTTLEDLNAMEAASAEHGCHVGLMLSERFGGYTGRMMDVIRSGQIGHVANVTCWRPHRLNRPKRPDWMFVDEQYGGIIVDLAVHDVDIIRWAAGGVFSEITAYEQNWGNPVDPEFTDIGVLLGRLSTGATGMVRTDWFTPELSPVHGDTRFLITGTRGMIEVRTAGDLWAKRHDKAGHVLVMTEDTPPKKLEYDMPGRTLVEDFIGGITGAAEQTLTTQDAFEATRATLMARRSAKLGRTVTRDETLG